MFCYQITPHTTKQTQKSKLFDIQQIKQKEKVKEKEKNPGRMFRGFRYCVVAAVVAVVAWLHGKNYQEDYKVTDKGD